MAERTRGWENRSPARSILIRPSCSAGHDGLRAWSGNSRGGGVQVRAVGHRGEQQRGPCWFWQGGEPGGEDGGQPVTWRQRLGGPAAAGRGIVGDHLGQLDQRHGITGGLGEDLCPGPAAGRARLAVQEAAGVGRGQRLQMQLGEAAVKAGGRGLAPGAYQQHDPLGVQAAAGEGQRVQRAAVQPVGIIGDHQDWGAFGQIRQQGQDGHPGQQQVGRAGVRRKTERPGQGPSLPVREPGGAGQHRPQQLMQPGEGESGLRFPAGDRQHPQAGPPGPAGGVGQEHGLAHPRLTGDQQDLAGLRDRIHQSAQPGQTGVPANDQCGPLCGEFTGTWHVACPLGQCVSSTPSPRPTATAARACPQRAKCSHTTDTARACLGATVMTGPEVTAASSER